MESSRAFHYRENKLFCEQVPLQQIARKVGTPCYVYSETAIRENYRKLAQIFYGVDPLICFAVKANSNLSVLKLLREEGAGFDIVSGGELFRLNQIDAPPSRIVFSGIGKTAAELRMALQQSIFWINVESLEELELLSRIASEEAKQCRISLRINPDIDAKTHPYISTGLRGHKFGLDPCQVTPAFEQIQQNSLLKLVGIGSHIGSQILNVDPYIEVFERIREMADQLRARGAEIEFIDVGGGFGIRYEQEELPDLATYGDYLEREKRDYKLVMEPGRYITGNAGLLVNQVLYRKQNHGKYFVIVDGAMNDFTRPVLYDAYHEIWPLLRRKGTVKGDLVGPVCETGDFFARDRELPAAEPGDYLAVMDTGAYGFVASSNYNSRPRAAEVLVSGDRYRIVRQRETPEDLIRGEQIDSW